MTTTPSGITEADLDLVRSVLRWIGAEVVERPAPVVATTDRSYYNRDLHEIGVHAGRRSSLLHELAHSQQHHPAPVSYYRADGSVDAATWLREPREQEAMAVETVAAELMARPDWPQIAAMAEGMAEPSLERAAWAAWIAAGDLTRKKPRQLARRARIAINNAVRELHGKGA